MATFEGRQITQLICPKPSSDRRGEAEGEGEAVGSEVAGERGADFEMRERGEAFMCVSLEVKNMVGVEDALKKMTEKETIEGYPWDDEVRERWEGSRWKPYGIRAPRMS